MSLIIRPVHPSDVDTLVAIEGESFSRPHWHSEDFLKYETWIAESNQQLVGFLVIREVYPGEREILNLAVARTYRRRGIATALLRRALSTGGKVYLEVRESNFAAQNLYRKLGFEEIGQRPNYYQSPHETAIVMKMK